jgi:hypothetical protein
VQRKVLITLRQTRQNLPKKLQAAADVKYKCKEPFSKKWCKTFFDCLFKENEFLKMYFWGGIGLYVEYNLFKNIVEYILLGKISE